MDSAKEGRPLDDQLAELLPGFPVIWDNKLKSHKDINKRENAYRQLAQTLGTTVEIVTNRYKALREKYRKERQKIEDATKSGSGQQNFEEWHLFQTLSFFRDVMTKRRTTANIMLNSKTNKETEQLELNPAFAAEEMYDVQELDLSLQSPPQFNLPDRNNNESFMESFSETITERCTSKPLTETVPTPSTLGSRTRKVGRLPVASNKSPVREYVDRLVIAAESTAHAAHAVAGINREEPGNNYGSFGKFVSETLTQIKEEHVDDAILEITQTLHKYKKKSRSD